MNSNTLIVGMTSWARRINLAHMSWRSILAQRESGLGDVLVKFVMVLSSEEFPDHSIPEALECTLREGGVELLWDKGNIRSHKKLMPILEKYPNNPVLVCDDDMIYKQGWLKAFIRMHKQYPTDIIYGQTCRLVLLEEDGYIRESRPYFNVHFPAHKTWLQKPANGAGGTLYPAHTFTRKEFFDRKEIMSLSPTSDEVWQWAWACIEGREFRGLDETELAVLNPEVCQQDSLYRTNRTTYSDIHNRIAEAYPEYRNALTVRQNPVAVTMYGTINKSAEKRIRKQSKRVIDVCYGTPVPEMMKKYPNACIIAVSGSMAYDTHLVDKLYNGYRYRPNCIVAGETIEHAQEHLCCQQVPLLSGGILFPPDSADVIDTMPVMRIDCNNRALNSK